jgi:Fic family protein
LWFSEIRLARLNGIPVFLEIQQIVHLVAESVSWLNAPTEIHPILASGIAQFQVVHIHPFVDGNGRTSRLLSTLCLYRAGYDFKRLFSISEYYHRDRAAFYAAIQGGARSRDGPDWLARFFREGLATQMDEVSERGERVIMADVMLQSIV